MWSTRTAVWLLAVSVLILSSTATAQVRLPRYNERALVYVHPDGLDIHRTGSFGLSELVAKMDSSGYRIQQVTSDTMPLTWELVRSYDLVVVSGLNSQDADRPFLCPEEQGALIQFVNRGGRLWIIGDADDPDRAWCNSASEPFGVTFVRDWGVCGRRLPFTIVHPLTDGISTIGVVGGAGFAVRSPAVALASPADDPSIALVGCSEYGDGRVVIVGDEMTFYDRQTGSCGVDLSDPNAVVLLDNILEWLGETKRQPGGGGSGGSLSPERLVPSLRGPLAGSSITASQIPTFRWSHNRYLATYPYLIDEVSYELEILRLSDRALQRFPVGQATQWEPTPSVWRSLPEGESLIWRVRAKTSSLEVQSFEGRFRLDSH